MLVGGLNGINFSNLLVYKKILYAKKKLPGGTKAPGTIVLIFDEESHMTSSVQPKMKAERTSSALMPLLRFRTTYSSNLALVRG